MNLTSEASAEPRDYPKIIPLAKVFVLPWIILGDRRRGRRRPLPPPPPPPPPPLLPPAAESRQQTADSRLPPLPPEASCRAWWTSASRTTFVFGCTVAAVRREGRSAQEAPSSAQVTRVWPVGRKRKRAALRSASRAGMGPAAWVLGGEDVLGWVRGNTQIGKRSCG